MLQGILPAMITPTRNNRVAMDVLEKYTAWLIKEPIGGVFALGTTGEGLLLEKNDWATAVQIIMHTVHRKVPVVVQCGGISFADTMGRIEVARAQGVEVMALMTPFLYRYSDEDLFKYFDELVGAWPTLNFYLYNIPKYTNNTIPPAVYVRLASRHANLLGIKDSSGSIDSIAKFIDAIPPLQVFSGSDTLMREAFQADAAGVVSGVAAALPGFVTHAWETLRAGNSERAERLVVITKSFHETSTIAAARMALEEQGLAVGSCLRPLPSTTEDDKQKLKSHLHALGIELETAVESLDAVDSLQDEV